MLKLSVLCFILFNFVICQTPIAKFSVYPEKFAFGQQFTAKCSVSDFVATDYAKYSTMFSIQPVETEIKNDQLVKIEMNLAKWTLAKGGTIIQTKHAFYIFLFSDPIPKFEVFPVINNLGLEISSTGQTATLPTFEVKMTAQNNRSRGLYYCKIQLWKIATDSNPTIESEPSNFWSTEPLIPDPRLGFFSSWGFIVGVSVLGVILVALLIFGILKWAGFFGKKHNISKEMFREREFD